MPGKVMMSYRSAALAVLVLAAAGCFYPPISKSNPPPEAAIIEVPYDLVWDATMAVIGENKFQVHAQDPVHGIIEAQTRGFSLADADCGLVSAGFGKTAAEPDQDATAVYNFHLAPEGPEATDLSIEATFSTPGHAPFHPMRDLGCTSKGVQEARLIKEIKTAAALLHRPAFKSPSTP